MSCEDSGQPAGLHLVVVASPNDERNTADADALAGRLNLPRAIKPDADVQLVLAVTHQGLELRVPPEAKGVPDGVRGGHPVRPSFEGLDVVSSAGRSLSNPLFKAVGVKKGQSPDERPRVLDCTAGWLEDSWLLASARCRVTSIERSPVIHAMLDDALCRCAKPLADLASRITLVVGDAGELLRDGELGPHDVILLDPMFPAERKAAERKAMRVLRLLAGDDADADDLLNTALHSAEALSARRVVVKRPRHAPPLLGRPPHHQAVGKGHRFDVYLPQPGT